MQRLVSIFSFSVTGTWYLAIIVSYGCYLLCGDLKSAQPSRIIIFTAADQERSHRGSGARAARHPHGLPFILPTLSSF